MIKQAFQITSDTLTVLQTGRLAYVIYNAAKLRVIGDSFVMEGRGARHSLLIASTDIEQTPMRFRRRRRKPALSAGFLQ